MSTKSKTGAKLVDSIRKSKTGAVASKTSERPAAKKTTAAKSTATKTKTAASRSSSTASKPASKASAKTAQTTSFSHGQRVWPD